MQRRTLLRGILAAGGLGAAGLSTTGCRPAPSGATPGTGPSTPPGGAPVALWKMTGGYVDRGLSALRPPRLAVYADGEVIADATYRMTLPADELATLLGKLVSDLKAPTTGRPSGSATGVVDAPTTVLRVWSGSTQLEAAAVGLDELRDRNVYSAAVYAARDRMGTLHRKVASTAQPYLAERVRVVVDTGTEAPDMRPWPSTMTIPSATGPDVARVADLDGDPAREAVRLLTRDLDHRGDWPTYQTADGRLLRASWRYLLPDE